MRLSDYEVNTIRQIVKGYDSNAFIYLYGSRTDNSVKGGDIDLLIMSNKINFTDKINILIKLKDRIGDQKIDLLIKKNTDNAFARKVLEEGILL